jgi:addiction module RelB/DinJ family antitoxin
MSSKTTVTFSIDREVKDKATKNAKKLGIPLSTLINMYLKDFSETGHVEFDVNRYPDEQMTPQMEKIIEQVEKEIANGEVSPTFGNAQDAIAYLEKLENDS